jgi:hypothetical protein
MSDVPFVQLCQQYVLLCQILGIDVRRDVLAAKKVQGQSKSSIAKAAASIHTEQRDNGNLVSTVRGCTKVTPAQGPAQPTVLPSATHTKASDPCMQ